MELHDVDPDRLLGDKGYDSDEIRDDLTDRGIDPVIPPRSNRKTPINYDREAYKRRNLIERCVNRLKQFRRITRGGSQSRILARDKSANKLNAFRIIHGRLTNPEKSLNPASEAHSSLRLNRTSHFRNR